MYHKRITAAILLAMTALTLAGCGGGGGGGGSFIPNPGGGNGGGNGNGILIGKVVDASGSPVPDATVSVDGGGQAPTVSQGDFRIENISPGVHRLTARANINGTNETGSTQALVISGNIASNANIQVSPTNQQATVKGTVRDQNGNALVDARVFLGIGINPAGDVASLVAFSDNNGNYTLSNVPTGPTAYTMGASLLHYQNQRVTVSNLQSGETRQSIDFQLSSSFNQSALTPTNIAVQSLTQPSAVPTPNIAGASATSPTSVYDHIRRVLSPTYARLKDRGHAAAQVHSLRHTLSAHEFGAYAVEMDVFFDNANQPDSLSGFRLYDSQGTNTDPSALTAFDFLQDPLANFYADFDPFYVVDQQYNFAVSAVNTDGTETALSSPVVSAVPLELLTLSQPQQGQTLSNPITVAWNNINGATGYDVFVYNAFPAGSVALTPLAQSGPLSGATTAYTLSGALASGHDYWVVVAATADNGAEISVSQITRFHVP